MHPGEQCGMLVVHMAGGPGLVRGTHHHRNVLLGLVRPQGAWPTIGAQNTFAECMRRACVEHTEENCPLPCVGGWSGHEFRAPGFLSLSRREREQENSLPLEIHGDKLSDDTFLSLF